MTSQEKATKNLKRIRSIQDLMRQGLSKEVEKKEAFSLAIETCKLFTNDILKRKAEKLENHVSSLKKYAPINGFLPSVVADQLDPWVVLIEEFLDNQKIKTEIENEKTFIKSVVDGEDQHIFITEKGTQEHAHLIMDGGTGEIRVDPKDQAPHELIKSVEAKLELNNGDTVRVTRSSLNFVEKSGVTPDVKAYTAKGGMYPVLEVYNSGEDDLENFEVTIYWNQTEGPQEKILTEYFSDTSDIAMGYPHTLNMLKIGAREFSQIPGAISDGKLKVIIRCKGMRSGLSIEKTFDLQSVK